jgi:hypothetical protein
MQRNVFSSMHAAHRGSSVMLLMSPGDRSSRDAAAQGLFIYRFDSLTAFCLHMNSCLKFGTHS